MSLRSLAALAAGLALANPSFAQERVKLNLPPRAADKPILDALHKGEVQVKGEEVADLPLMEMLQLVSKRHGVTFVIMEEEFRRKQVEGVKEKKSPLRIQTKGLTLHTFLNAWLAGIDATYRAEPDYVAIVPLAPVAAQNAPPPVKPRPTAETILKALHESEVGIEGDLNTIPLLELLQQVSNRHGIPIVILDEAFRAEEINDIKERKFDLTATTLKGITLHQFLSIHLGGMNATYLVKNGRIEIVPFGHAARTAGVGVTEVGNGRKVLAEPLVSVIVKERPLNEVLAELAERYDLNVTVAPQSGDARTGFVTARLLNVPADKAVEQLALLCDLRVVRKGNTFTVTSRDHANELFNEKLDRERQKIEVERLRTAPPKPEPEPIPPPKPDKP